jgi:hypothetical protein
MTSMSREWMTTREGSTHSTIMLSKAAAGFRIEATRPDEYASTAPTNGAPQPAHFVLIARSILKSP